MTANNTKTAVVTGADRGIGRDIAHRFLDDGYTVISVSLQTPDYSHERLIGHEADLSDKQATVQAARKIAAEHQVTTFVHNAGVIKPALLDDVSLDDLDYLTQLHLGAAISCTQCFLPAMRTSRFGRIVFVSSRGVLGLVTRTSYAATKAGQIGLVRTWALELAKDGITVNAVAPGPIVTDMFHELVPEDSPQKQKIAESVPVKRLGAPADIGRVVKFLCEPESSFVTGQTWYVCGGASLGSLAL